jgi:hypothetical protein
LSTSITYLRAADAGFGRPAASVDHAGAALDQAKDLIRLETDIGVNEQEMRRGRIVEKLRDQAGSRPGDESIAVLEQDLQRNATVGPHHLFQPQQRRGIIDRYLTAEARGPNHEIDGRCGRWRQHFSRPRHLSRRDQGGLRFHIWCGVRA